MGLTVRAPRPVACEDEGGKPGITDILRAEDDGVAVPRPLGLPGERPPNEDERECSGVETGASRCDAPCLIVGCIDLDFAARAEARRAPVSAALAVLFTLDLEVVAESPRLLWREILFTIPGRLLGAPLAARSEVSNIPGPTDFLVPFIAPVPDIGG